MPKRSNPTDKKAKRKHHPRKHKKAKHPKGQVIHPVNRQHQYHAVHNSALKNFTRDTAHAEKIKEKIKHDETLTEHRMEDLLKKQRELIKH